MTRKRPSTGFYTAVVIAWALFLYVFTLGPACWASSRVEPAGRAVSGVYRPLIWIWIRTPRPLMEAIATYAGLGIGDRIIRLESGDSSVSFE
jgi:hypothetical protein